MADPLMYLDCYLELDPAGVGIAREMNRRIVASIGGSVDFSRGTIPHITLFMGLFPSSEQHAVLEGISQCAATHRGFSVRFGGLSLSPEGYLFWDVFLDDPLAELHRKLVTTLNPLRRGAIRPKFLETIDRHTVHEQENIRNYGFPWILNTFSPHVTIGAASPDAARLAIRDLETHDYTFDAKYVGVGTVGDSGVVFESGTKFSLSPGK